MRCIFFTLLLPLFLVSCQVDKANENGGQVKELDLGSTMQGTWQTYQLNIAVNTADGLDSFRAEYLNQDIWEKELGIQPPIYYFMADQRFRLVRLGLRGDIMDESEGTWSTKGDTLWLKGPELEEQYIVKHSKGRAGFRTMLDWDGDGEEDDEYQSLQRQISIGTN